MGRRRHLHGTLAVVTVPEKHCATCLADSDTKLCDTCRARLERKMARAAGFVSSR